MEDVPWCDSVARFDSVLWFDRLSQSAVTVSQWNMGRNVASCRGSTNFYDCVTVSMCRSSKGCRGTRQCVEARQCVAVNIVSQFDRVAVAHVSQTDSMSQFDICRSVCRR